MPIAASVAIVRYCQLSPLSPADCPCKAGPTFSESKLASRVVAM